MFVAQTKDTLSEIYLDSLKIRNDVFVKEQGVPLSLEIDQDEANAVHLFSTMNKRSNSNFAAASYR